MEDLLFEDFPTNPAGAGSQLKKAIVLKHNWTYDDSANYVPLAMRNTVPSYLKTNGKLHLPQGTEGFLYEICHQERRGAAVFLIRCTLIYVVVPLTHITIGADFIPLSQKVATHPQAILADFLTTSDYIADNQNPLDSAIHTLWLTLRSKIQDLQALGMDSDLVNLYFGPSFQQSIKTLTEGFLPDARRVLQNGNYSVNDLLSIPRVTDDWSPNGPTVYILLYDNDGSTIPRSAIYVGQSNETRMRYNAHNRFTAKEDTRHYQTARKFAPEHRHMIPICNWDDDIPPYVLNMAEQTAMLLLDSYFSFLKDIPPNTPSKQHYLQSRFMSRLARDVLESLPWATNVGLTGLNLESPIFRYKVFRCITSVPNLQSLESTHTFTRYRTPIRLFPGTQDNSDLKYIYHLTLMDSSRSGEKVSINLFLPPEDVESMEIPESGFLVFEVMDNKQPHPSPWIGSTAVGPYEDFIQASSLGIRYEWYDKSQNIWLSTTIHKPGNPGTVLWTWKHKNIKYSLSTWRNALHIIQALKGIVYSDFQPNQGFHKRLTFGRIPVLQLQMCHLEQTYGWVQRPEISQPFPKKATFQYNFKSLFERFTSVSMYIPSEPIPGKADVNQPMPLLGVEHGTKFGDKCDFCVLSSVLRPLPCEPDDSSPYGNVCKLCSLFNRPCTFTRRRELGDLWGYAPPALGPRSPLAMYPTGPLRFLAFHATRSQGVFQTPEPREKLMGLFPDPDSIEGTDVVEEMEPEVDMNGGNLDEDY
ncbi:hypothetical protein HDV62DRAFT_404441 [Trichoderma sp. SZMC 28011]